MNNMEKRAFTLIELLSVIVVLAIVAIIAVPKILNVIEDSKEQSIIESTRTIARVAENYYARETMNQNQIGIINLEDNILKYDGKQAEKGKIKFENGKAIIKMYYDGYCVVRNSNKEIEINKTSLDECNIDDMFQKECENNITGFNIELLESDELNDSEKNIDKVTANNLFVYQQGEKGYIITDLNNVKTSCKNSSSENCIIVTIPETIGTLVVEDVSLEDIKSKYSCINIKISQELVWDSELSSDSSYRIITGLTKIGKKLNNVKTPNKLENLQVQKMNSILSSNLEKLVVTENINEFMSNCMFENCPNLLELEMQVKNEFTIGKTSLSKSNIKEINYTNKNLTKLPDYAFSNATKMTDYSYPETVTEIGTYAFYYCTSLKKMIIPEYITKINSFVISYSGVAEVEMQVGNNVTLMNNIWLNANNLTKIEYTNETLTKLPNYAFYGATKMTEYSYPKNVIEIGNSAFYGCRGLTEINFSEKIVKIGDYVFRSCTNLITITGLNKVISIGENAFEECTSLTNISLDSVEKIGMRAFKKCNSLKSIVIPKTIKSLGAYFLEDSGVTKVEMQSDDSYTKHSQTAFANSNITEIHYTNETLTKLPQNAFGYAKKMTKYSYPDSVKTIDTYAFYYCESLEKVIIPETITKLNSSIFHNSGVKEIELQVNDNFTISGYAWNNSNITKISYTNPNLTTLPAYAFARAEKLIDYSYPDSVTTISDFGFAYFTTLIEITDLKSVTTIGEYAFSGCTGLTSVSGLTNVTSIGRYAFKNCTALKEITIPNTVITIGHYTFQDCTNLEKIYYSGSASGRPWGAPSATVISE